MPKAKRRNRKGGGQVLRSGKSWAIRFTTEEGERRYVGKYPNKDDATQALAVITSQITAGLPGLKKKEAPAPLIGDLVEEWLQSRAGKRSVRDDQIRWKRHLHQPLRGLRIDAVTSKVVDAVRADLANRTGADELSPGTLERILYTLSAFFRWAIRLEHTTSNPVRLYLEKLNADERKALRSDHDPTSTPFISDPRDVIRIFEKLPAPMNVAYALSAKAGLRPGEALALEWAEVDLDRGIIKVRQRVRHGRVEATTKGGKPRQVSIGPWLLGVLKTWRTKTPGVLVVPPQKGTDHLGDKAVGAALKEALPALGLPAMTYYEAGRHSYASQWVLAGGDIYRLSAQMGHASIVTTQRYAHLTAKVPAEMLAQLDAGMTAEPNAAA